MPLRHLIVALAIGAVKNAVIAATNDTTFFASPSGSDTNAGTSRSAPFQHAAKCVEAASEVPSGATGTCILLPGVYHEELAFNKVNLPAAAIVILGEESTNGQRAVLHGGDAVPALLWKAEPDVHGGAVYSASLADLPGPPVTAATLHQVFLDRAGLPSVAADSASFATQVSSLPFLGFEARWPNAGLDDMLNRSSAWSPTGTGSRYGKIVDPSLAHSGVKDWTGALATLQVAHQFFTWTRQVTSYHAGNHTFFYPQDLPGITNYASMTTPWEHNKYFLSGVFEALDSPGEFFFNDTTKRLFFWPHDGRPPADRVSVKRRDFCVEAGGASLDQEASPRQGADDDDDSTRHYHDPSQWDRGDDVDYDDGAGASFLLQQPFDTPVSIDNVDFLGCTFSLTCNGCSVSNSHGAFSSYHKTIPEMNPPGPSKGSAPTTRLDGSGNSLTNVTIAFTNNAGVKVAGNDTTVANCVVYSTDWLGTLTYPPLSFDGHRNVATRNTVAYFGNAGITQHQTNNTASYNHVHHGGLIGLDHAALYTGGWTAAGTHWHHNWIHDHQEKCVRGDDQSHNMTVHHNVIFNCGSPVRDQEDVGFGLIVKGNYHVLYANTIFQTLSGDLVLPACQEPYKPWAHQWPLDPHQNNDTLAFNSAWNTTTGRASCRSNETQATGGHRFADFNGTVAAMQLEDWRAFNFTPAAGSPLVDAGALVPPYTDGDHHVGSRPDIGAYERGGEAWVPGSSLPLPAHFLAARSGGEVLLSNRRK